MKIPFLALLAAIATLVTIPQDASAADEAATIQFFAERGDRVTRDEAGHAIKLFCSGKPELSVEDLQRIGELAHLEELALNASPADDSQWGFLKSLPKLLKLTLWHGHHFKSLEAFNGLPVESITFGGCMGLRDLNRDDPSALRNAVLSLHDLPRLKSLTLYHSPLTPDDAHLAHIAEHFPQLTELRIDFAAPRGQETKITATGSAHLARLPLTKLGLENAESLAPEVIAELGKSKTLRHIHVFPARGSAEVHQQSVANYNALLKSVRAQLPSLEITYQEPFLKQ